MYIKKSSLEAFISASTGRRYILEITIIFQCKHKTNKTLNCNKFFLYFFSTINEGKKKKKKNEKISSLLKLRLQLRFNCRIQDPLSP